MRRDASPSFSDDFRLSIETPPQPDETTCGPTCLQAVYRYWGLQESLDAIARRTQMPEQGGTFAVFLGCDALRRGLHASIYTYNLNVFDPTWFRSSTDIGERLMLQREIKTDPRLQAVTPAYLEFLRLGGRLRFTDLSPTLLHRILRRGLPIITGLSSTYLYHHAREHGPLNIPDDVRGVPTGHFVLIAGYNASRRRVLIADPYQPHPYGTSREYWLNIDRAVGAVLLGIVTHDANLLIVYPKGRKTPP